MVRSRAGAKQMSNGVAHLLRKNKVTVLDGQGKHARKGNNAVFVSAHPDGAIRAIGVQPGARASGAYSLFRSRAQA